MRELADERLAQLRDTYGPGWLEEEASVMQSALLGQCMSTRTRQYLRTVEARRSVACQHPPSQHWDPMTRNKSGRSIDIRTKSTPEISGTGTRGRRNGQGTNSDSQLNAGWSSDNVLVDLPIFNESENVV